MPLKIIQISAVTKPRLEGLASQSSHRDVGWLSDMPVVSYDSGKSFLLSAFWDRHRGIIGDPQQMTDSQAFIDHLGWYDP